MNLAAVASIRAVDREAKDGLWLLWNGRKGEH